MFFQAVSRLLVLALLALVPFQTFDTAAFQNRDVSQSNGSTPKRATVGAGIVVLSDTAGVDFNPYLYKLCVSVKNKWFSKMPPSVEKGQVGKNTVQFRVMQDGSVPKEFLKLNSSSKKEDFDKASLQAVREAAPLARLPEKFSHPFIELRITFYYNIPQQDDLPPLPVGPKIIPIDMPVNMLAGIEVVPD